MHPALAQQHRTTAARGASPDACPLLLQDLLRFGNSTREYVLLKEK